MRQLIIPILLCIGLLGCGREDGPSAESSKASAKGEASTEITDAAQRFKDSSDPKEQELGRMLENFLAKAPEPQFPLWSQDNLGWHTDKFVTYLHELSRKPPFYKGSMPLEYTSGKSAGGILFFHDFGGFRNQFKLNDSFIIIGARTVDGRGRLLAEARARYYVKGNEQGIELEEFHYDEAGNVNFKCKSEVDSGTGHKVGEKEKTGRKDRDYYFLWPTR